ncbi:MAG: VWA domain-containing protein [Saprospiraceae bacterium]|nr:VWA domain-containing protein [Saprospiraceae bacterium]
MNTEKLTRWRLILGRQADSAEEILLSQHQMGMDNALDLLYNEDRKGGLNNSAPRINRWLRDIRQYFQKPVVQLLQKDALERLGLKQMLLESEFLETVTPDVHLAAALLSLNKTLPEPAREAARQIVRAVVQDLEKKLRLPMQQAIQGSIHRGIRNYRPKLNEINWHHTIRKNLKHYQPDYQTIIPERLVGFGRKGTQLRHVILCIDQSGSMATSVVYAAVLGSIMASLRSVKTSLVVFDTNVVDLSEMLNDPVDLLFAAQLGGGTDIAKALDYSRTLVQRPHDTIFVLISDLYEGGSENEMIQKITSIKSSGVQFISLLALNDEGTPSYSKSAAAHLAALGIPAFACTPALFPGLMAAAIHKNDLRDWSARHDISVKN